MRLALAPYISAVSLTVCSLLVLMWVRSDGRCEGINHTGQGGILVIGSTNGVVFLYWRKINNQFDNGWNYADMKVPTFAGREYQFEWTPQKMWLRVPHRALVSLFAVVGIAPWIRSKRSLVEALLVAAPHVPGIISSWH
jgi:hypothetical protein